MREHMGTAFKLSNIKNEACDPILGPDLRSLSLTVPIINFEQATKKRWIDQWEFQDPKMEALYHIRPYFVGISPYIGRICGRYLQFRFLKWPLN